MKKELDWLQVAKKLILILWCTAICGGLSAYYSFQKTTTEYEAVSSIMILNKPSEVSTPDKDAFENTELILELLAGQAIVNDFQTILQSDVILNEVQKKLTSNYGWAKDLSFAQLKEKTDVTIRSDTSVLNIGVTDADPEHAAVISNEVKDVFSAFMKQKLIQNLIIDINAANVPDKPSFPKPKQFIALGAVTGMLTGLILMMWLGRRALIWKWLFSVIASIAVGLFFMFLLRTHFYVYVPYLLLGLFYYLLVKRFGREVSFLFLIPIVSIALVLVGQIFILDFYDHNGLNPLKIHPMVLALLVMIYLTLAEDILRKKFVWDRITVLTIMIFGIFAGITVLHRGLSGISQFNHNYLAPMSFFFFIYSQKRYNEGKLRLFGNVLLIVMAIIGIMGLFEYVLQVNPLQTIYDNETPTWIEGTYHEGYRIKTTIGHPLDNALIFLFSMIMVQVNVKKIVLKYPLLILFMMDILVSGSRSIFILSFLVLLYNDSIKASGWAFIRRYLLFLVPVGLLIAGLIFSPFGQTFLNRINGAASSTEARYLIFDYFFHHLFSFQMLGLGGGTEDIILYNSQHETVLLENPWIILFFEVGYFVLLFVYYLYAIIKKIDYKFFVVVLLIALSAMNSFGVKTIDIYALFYLLTYFYALRKSRDIPATPH